ncbi:MAG: hypothetical protein ABI051_13385 [Vicinamibacterales bacterium]
MQSPPVQPSLIVTVVPQTPAPQTTLADVVVGALGLTGALLLLALVLGAGLAFVRVSWNRRHPAAEDHLPPVSPLVTRPSGRPSSPAQ